MVLEVRLTSGEAINVGEKLLNSLERCSHLPLDDVQEQLRWLLGSQCTVFSGEDSVSVWPWVVGLCHVYKQKGHILKDFEEVPSGVHAKFLKLEFLEGHTLETFRKSVREEAQSITIKNGGS
jgi:hypothetical protein